MKIVVFIHKVSRKALSIAADLWNHMKTRFVFVENGVEYSSFRTKGVPYLVIAKGGENEDRQ